MRPDQAPADTLCTVSQIQCTEPVQRARYIFSYQRLSLPIRNRRVLDRYLSSSDLFRPRSYGTSTRSSRNSYCRSIDCSQAESHFKLLHSKSYARLQRKTGAHQPLITVRKSPDQVTSAVPRYMHGWLSAGRTPPHPAMMACPCPVGAPGKCRRRR